ncbi:MAG: rhamnulose-1-phosphate aldolase [Robiginitomaculum sp.]|nr:rhamnulose-1-phosphate aldolase [Robiginitomaculum sp.]
MTRFSYAHHLEDFKSTTSWLARRGWSEAAGGNLSLRLEMPGSLHEDDHIPLPFPMPHLAGKAILLTGSGTRAREIGVDPQPHVGLFKISDDGTSYGWIAGNRKPSMELPAHCAIHNTLAEHRPEDKAILHTHPASLIALCHVQGLDNGKVISDKILSLQSEARLILPEGIGFVEHELPGSLELGIKSAAQAKKHQLVLWQFHGCLATGETLAHAFDLLEVFEKSARVYWKLRTAGIDPAGIPKTTIENTLTYFGRLDRYKSTQE